MSSEASHFKIGIFVVTSVVILIGLLLMLGALEQFQVKYLVETYLDEPIEALDRGSKVAWRGMKIGEVHSLGFVHAEYGEPQNWENRDYRFVLIRMVLYPRLFGENWTQEEFEEFLHDQIQQGVRVKLVPPMLPGPAYLDMDYVEPKNLLEQATDNGIRVTWEPQYPYIPSTPSTIHRFVKSVEDLFGHIEQIDLQELVKTFEGLLETLDSSVQELDFKSFQDNFESISSEIQNLLSQTREIVAHVDGKAIAGIIDDASKTARTVSRISENAEAHIDRLMQDFTLLSENMNDAIAEVKDFLKDEKLKQGLDDFPEITHQIRESIEEINALLSREQGSVSVILDNLRVLSENLREISEEARRYPAGMLLGGPPPKTEREEGQQR